MTIDFHCSNCGARLHAPEEYAGGSARCERCTAKAAIPGRPTAHAESAAGHADAPGPQYQHAPPVPVSGPHRGPSGGPGANRMVTVIVVAMIAVTFITLGSVALWRTAERNRRERTATRIAKARTLIDDGRVSEAGAILRYEAQENLSEEERREVDELLASIQSELQEIERREAALAQSKSEARERQRRQALPREHEQQRREVARKTDNLQSVGGAVLGVAWVFGLFVGACILIGLGQLFTAFRDIAINSYLLTGPDSQETARTPAPPGQLAPRYRFIPFVSLIFYIAGGIEIVAATVILFIVLANL